MSQDAYIYDAVRSPRGKGRADGGLHATTAVDLSAQMLNAIVDRNDFDPKAIDDVIWGNVTQVMEQGACVGRASVLHSKLPESVPGLSINRFCGSGLEASNLAAHQVQAGQAEAFIAGGVEMMSRVAMGSDGAAMAADPRLAIDSYFIPQGISADLIATKYGFTRDEADALAVESQRRAARSWEEGRFAKSIVAVKDVNGRVICERDEHMRPGSTMEDMAKLNAAFEMMGTTMPGFDKVALLKYPELEKINHIHTAANSSGIVDGSAAILIGSKAFGEKHGLKPRARFRATARIGSEPTINLTGPVPVTERIMAQSGMSLNDIDLIEINEAFAAVVLRFQQAFNVDMDKVNVNGGAMALGHPLGATGAIILGTALDELERSDKETALCTLCIAAGMGVATIIERV